MNSPRSIYSNMNPWLSICGLFFSVLKSLLGIARQCSREKFAILSLKPWGQVSTLIYWTWLLLTITARRPYWSFSWLVNFKSWRWMLTITCFRERDQTGVGHFFWKISPWTETFPFWFDKNFWKSKYNFPHTLTFVVQFDRLVTCLQAKNTDNCLFDSLNLSFSKKGASTLEARYLLSTLDSFYLILLISLFTSKQGFVLTTGNRTRDLSHRRPHSNPMCQSCAT